MPINHVDGQYALDMWEDPESEDEPDDTEYSDNINTLRDRATTVLKAGRFKWLTLYHWNADIQDWDSLEDFYNP